MKTARLLLAVLVIALASGACSADVTGPVNDGCPTIGGGGTCL